MRGARLMIAAVVATAIAAGASVQGGTAGDASPDFSIIRQKLSSADFSQREMGQKLLDQVPPDRMEFVRAQAAQETDPEVKARLEARVDAMEAYLLLHPAPLTLEVEKASLGQVAEALNAQLGGGISIQAAGDAASSFTLSAKQQPFWDVLLQLNKQAPLNFTALTSLTVAGTSYSLRLTPSAVPREYRVSDAFALTAQVAGTPAAGSWSIRFVIISDPRVRVLQYSPFRAEKIVDQDGASLLPLVASNGAGMATVARPVTSWSSNLSLNKAPGVSLIKELRGTIAVSVVEKEKLIVLDTTRDVTPVDTPRGRVSIVKAADGQMTLHMEPPEGDAGASGLPPLPGRGYISIRAVTANGSTLTTTVSGGTLNIAMAPGGQPPSRVEITWTEKVRDLMIPVQWDNLAVPAPAAVQPNPGNPVNRPVQIQLR